MHLCPFSPKPILYIFIPSPFILPLHLLLPSFSSEVYFLRGALHLFNFTSNCKKRRTCSQTISYRAKAFAFHIVAMLLNSMVRGTRVSTSINYSKVGLKFRDLWLRSGWKTPEQFGVRDCHTLKCVTYFNRTIFPTCDKTPNFNCDRQFETCRIKWNPRVRKNTGRNVFSYFQFGHFYFINFFSVFELVLLSWLPMGIFCANFGYEETLVTDIPRFVYFRTDVMDVVFISLDRGL